MIERRPGPDETPPPTSLTPEAIFVEWLGGLTGGVVLAMLTLYITLGTGPERNIDRATVGFAAALAQVAYALGVPGGIAFVGRSFTPAGSLGLAMVGSALGGGLAWFVGSQSGLLPNFRGYAITFGLVTLVVALVGYNLPRLRQFRQR